MTIQDAYNHMTLDGVHILARRVYIPGRKEYLDVCAVAVPASPFGRLLTKDEAHKKWVPWVPQLDDLLADDWETITIEEYLTRPNGESLDFALLFFTGGVDPVEWVKAHPAPELTAAMEADPPKAAETGEEDAETASIRAKARVMLMHWIAAQAKYRRNAADPNLGLKFEP